MGSRTGVEPATTRLVFEVTLACAIDGTQTNRGTNGKRNFSALPLSYRLHILIKTDRPGRGLSCTGLVPAKYLLSSPSRVTYKEE